MCTVRNSGQWSLCTYLGDRLVVAEQLGRRSINEVFDFLGELEVDAVAAGRQLVGEILGLAGEA